MKFLLKSFSAVLILGLFVNSAEAQIFKKLKKKAQDALEKKAEQKIDEEMQKAADRMVEDSWNTVFGAEGENGQPGGKLPFKLNSNVKTEDVYRFNVITTMKIESEPADGESEPPLYMGMHFKEGVQYTGTKFRGEQMNNEQGDLFLVYDFKNSAMIMLMESEDGKFSFAYDWQQAMQTAEEMETEQPSEEPDWDEVEEWNGYKKIGTKEIAGYSCDGYRSESEHSIVEIWVTRDAAYGMQNMFQANANAKQLKGKIPEDYPYGMMMEMNSEDMQNGDKVTMRVIDIRTGADVSYAMADYPFMSLGKKWVSLSFLL